MSDFCLTLDQVARANEAHGGMACTDSALGVLCHGKHTVELLNPKGEPEGWCSIRRDEMTGLCSLSDLREALGY